MVAMLIGRGFRRAELLALRLDSIQQRREHWVIADLVAKGGHVRTVPIPTWVENHVDAWTAAATIAVQCSVRSTRPVESGATACRRRCCGMSCEPRQLAPASTSWRRTICDARAPACAISRAANSDQIQFLLGHVSIQTTERYLGCKQRLRIAVNDRLGIEPDAA
jgi:integrase